MKPANCVALCLAIGLAYSPHSHAARNGTLSPADALSLQGRTLSIVTHAPIPLNIMGTSFQSDKGEFEKLQEMLGPDLKIVRYNPLQDTDGVTLEGKGIADPAPAIAMAVGEILASRYGVKTTGRTPLMTAATPTGKMMFLSVVPKTSVDDILAAEQEGDLVLDVQTYGWQAARNASPNLFFVYIARMALVDARSRSILVEKDCVYANRKAWTSKPYLLGFFGNGMAPLQAELKSARDHCLADFTEKSLRVPGGRSG